MCQNSLPPSGGIGHLEPRFQGKGRPWGNFFGFYKTRHILLSDSANCTVLRAVVLTQYRRVTDGQTDGIAVASTALAMRRAVKTKLTLSIALNPKSKLILDRGTNTTNRNTRAC